MKFILGKKLDMTRIWQGEKVVPVTRIQVGPCYVTAIKTTAKDGYSAIQISFGTRRERNIKRPQRGQLQTAQAASGSTVWPRFLREFRAAADVKLGDAIDVNTFAPGDSVDVVGQSKGKGFQGVIRRHKFTGTRKTHGNKDQARHSGSIGAKGPARVVKGVRMGGHMGAERVTVKNLKIVAVDTDNNILSIAGAVPGARNGLLLIKGQGDLKIKAEAPTAPAA
jgi:large subunit ribosomal protein L3